MMHAENAVAEIKAEVAKIPNNPSYITLDVTQDDGGAKLTLFLCEETAALIINELTMRLAELRAGEKQNVSESAARDGGC